MTEPLRHRAGVRDAFFSPDGRKVLTTSDDKSARIWDAITGLPLTPPLIHEGSVLSGSFSPDGLRVATASVDHSARIWETQTGRRVGPPLKHDDVVRNVHFNPDGQRLVTASDDMTAAIWDAQTGKRVFTSKLKEKPNAASFPARFSPDGKLFLFVHGDTCSVGDAFTGKAILPELRHNAPVSSAEFSPDGSLVLTASRDNTTVIWQTRTGKAVRPPFRLDAPVCYAQFDPEGRRVVTACRDGSARIWDAGTGDALTEPLKHAAPVTFAHFSPDGGRVVTTSSDYQARVWHAQSGQPVTDPIRHELLVGSARFSPDNRRIITASLDGTARIWELPSVPIPAPGWLPTLAECVVALRYNDRGAFEPSSVQQIFQLKDEILQSGTNDFYGRWARWFFADHTSRAISPFSSVGPQDFVERRLGENTVASLREALLVSPTDLKALSQLARRVPAERVPTNSLVLQELQRHLLRASRLVPSESAISQAQAILLEQTRKAVERRTARNQELEP